MSYQPINVLPALLRVMLYLFVAFVCGVSVGIIACNIIWTQMHPLAPKDKVSIRILSRPHSALQDHPVDPHFSAIMAALREHDARCFGGYDTIPILAGRK